MSSVEFGLVGVLSAAAKGDTVVTANKRAARAVLSAYDRRELADRLAWRTPDIIAWDGFILRCWNDLVYSGGSALTLLNAAQERVLWEQIISADGALESLLSPAATIDAAQQAWKLARAYRLPLDSPLFSKRPESAAFACWAGKFAAECRARNWLDNASLPDVLLTATESGRVTARRRVLLVGFDRFTQQQDLLFEVLGARKNQPIRVPTLRSHARSVSLVCAEDADCEIKASATWARRTLEANASARIGIIVPALDDLRRRIESVFMATLHPDQLPAGRSERLRAFELSLGSSLSEQPIVASGLLFLKLCLCGINLAEAGQLLRSPFLTGYEAESAQRAQADAALRREGRLEFTLSALIRSLQGRCPALRHNFKRAAHALANGSSLSPRRWAEILTTILDAAGWPNPTRALSSDEYQVLEAWQDLLSHFASLESVQPAMNAQQCFARMFEMARERIFEAEKHDAPVQVLGLLEAAGTEFTHLWVMGLHDAQWPSQSAPNPFLPYTLQVQYGVPHASPAAELQFASTVRERLLHSAETIVFSYPTKDGETELRPSPLLCGLPNASLPEITGEPYRSWCDELAGAGSKLEAVCDELGPALAEGTEVRGGTRILERQSNCPFRAFFDVRLGASDLETAQPGLDQLKRGNIIHIALENVWKKLRTHAALVQHPELPSLVEACVAEAIEQTHAAGNEPWEREIAQLEQRRATFLILQLLDLEKQRAPFTVLDSEKARTVNLGGLLMHVKADRVDALDDGRRVLLDYKTGKVTVKSWEGKRPESPQLPAYAALSEGELAAIAFAKVKAGEVEFQGYSPDPKTLQCSPPYQKSTPGKDRRELRDVVAGWKEIVERLATEYRQGHAAVDPVRGHLTCRNCSLPAICRYSDDQIIPEPEEVDDAG